MIKDDFSTVCSWVQFQNKVKWRYDLFLKKHPVPIKCPVAGKFNFTQKGDVPFETRLANEDQAFIPVKGLKVCQNRQFFGNEKRRTSLKLNRLNLTNYYNQDYFLICVIVRLADIKRAF